ncbi:efflux RND transporter periplasmic adaptor subunit [Rubripirellula reticaptiva]|uniref:Dihydrolipoamide acetyltransferase n=1 Tax=Rubripirellula reticaptiva TaxID=2528013 RepID=A0A5C6F4V0_9BACT|nr:HlyD family efflux transporter periplasmic adaptor subunit [Rubripirellula reticaptiva]TWU56225.1 dihydrolipoamide acetyltransferase [Rubripirellula reticaptiva]
MVFFSLSTGTGSACADDLIQFENLVVTVIDSVEVPSAATGVISKLAVREGQSISAGDLIASTDDRESRVRAAIAKTQLEILQQAVDDCLATEQAEAELGAQRQTAKEHLVRQQIAQRMAKNSVRIEAAEKSAAVAKNELDRALRSRAEYAESISKSEIDGLRLVFEKSLLDTTQAKVEHDIDQLKADAEAETAEGHLWSIQQSKLALQQSRVNKIVDGLKLTLGDHQKELANLESQRHLIKSPLDGVVVEIHRKPGDWVVEGEPIARVIRLDRLRAEGYASADQIQDLRNRPMVELSIRIGSDEVITRTGEVVFVSPEIDPVNNEAKFWIEFDNPNRDVLPGMHLTASRSP